MAGLDVLFNVLFSLFDLLKAAFILSIPFFLLALLGSFIHSRIKSGNNIGSPQSFQNQGLASINSRVESGKNTGWLKSAFFATFIIALVFVFAAYFIPAFKSIVSPNIGQLPAVLAPEPQELLIFGIYLIAKLFFAAFILAIIALPFEIAGSLVYDWALKKRLLPKPVALYITVFAACFAAFALFIIFFQWAFLGLVYLIYFA